jgi:Protein of unknown function (DUF4435)
MITAEESIPSKSQNYLMGQDILWSQFNDLNFYVEDADQENFYYHILKKIFPNVKISRIFPLGGKRFVIDKAKGTISDKTKIFILDKDFDDILNKKENHPNLFYLKKYSIENYLIEEVALHEIIKEENTKIKDTEIKNKLKTGKLLDECKDIFGELACNFLLIKKFDLGLDYLGIEPLRDCNLKGNCCIKQTVTVPFYQQVEKLLKEKHPRLRYSTQIKKAMLHFSTAKKALINIPGKYLLNYIQQKIRTLFAIAQIKFDRFIYRLAKNCILSELNYLRGDILQYIG